MGSGNGHGKEMTRRQWGQTASYRTETSSRDSSRCLGQLPTRAASCPRPSMVHEFELSWACRWGSSRYICSSEFSWSQTRAGDLLSSKVFLRWVAGRCHKEKFLFHWNVIDPVTAPDRPKPGLRFLHTTNFLLLLTDQIVKHPASRVRPLAGPAPRVLHRSLILPRSLSSPFLGGMTDRQPVSRDVCGVFQSHLFGPSASWVIWTPRTGTWLSDVLGFV